MNRLFSIYRRRPHIVDVLVPITAGVDGYRLKWATNFDATFATFLTSTNVGFRDANVNPNVIDTQPANRQARIVFDPTTYSIPDDKTFWMKFVPVTGGVEGTAGAATMVLSDQLRFQAKLIVITGTAPSAATSAASLQIDLPAIHDIKINVVSNRDLLLAVEPGGAEFAVPKNDAFVASLGQVGVISSIYVRGDGGTAAFSLAGTVAYSE